MQVSLITVDNFYSNVDEVRQFSLQQPFDVEGNYPGRRTKSFLNDSIKEIIQSLIKHDKSWIHADHTSNWAGIVYLTPNAPPSGGTGFFKHKETGLASTPYTEEGIYDENTMNEIYKDSQDMTKWEMTDQVSNVYNRLILYRGDMFHQSLEYFGNNIYDSRLFQTFFFNTEL